MSSPYYWVSLTYVVVGGKHVLTPAVAIFDTGTTYTYLTTTYYNKVAAAVRTDLNYLFPYFEMLVTITSLILLESKNNWFFKQQVLLSTLELSCT